MDDGCWLEIYLLTEQNYKKGGPGRVEEVGNDDYFISQRLDATGMLNFREKQGRKAIVRPPSSRQAPELKGTNGERTTREVVACLA